MKLDVVYRDVISRATTNDVEPLFLDVVNAINDAISTKRIEYILKGNAQHLTERESFFFTGPDFEYPFAFSASLSKNIVSTLRPEQSIVNGFVWHVNETISAQIKSYVGGTVAQQGAQNYIALEDIVELSSSGLTFDPDVVFQYLDGDCMNYKTGQYVLNIDDNSVYYVLQPFTNTPGFFDVNTRTDYLQKRYWEQFADGYVFAEHKSFEYMNELRLYSTMPRQYAFTVNRNKLYCSSNIKRFTIEYVAEWTPVEDLDVELDLPYQLIAEAKEMAVQLVARKYGRINVEEQ